VMAPVAALTVISGEYCCQYSSSVTFVPDNASHQSPFGG
jgi:hypothetical protein